MPRPKAIAVSMRDHLSFFLNGQLQTVSGRGAFEMLAPYLRRERGLCGTKIACAHGACGSCSILLGKPTANGFHYSPINSCILPVFGCDGAHIITVEGLNGPEHIGGRDDGVMSEVQRAMVDCHASQCGFCTPGIAVTLTAFHQTQTTATREKICSALEGNLCRCTGYSPIIEAGMSVETANLKNLNELYPPKMLRFPIQQNAKIDVAADEIEGEQHLFVANSMEAAATWKAEHPNAVVTAGATETGVAMSVKGFAPREILSLARVEGADEVTVENGALVLGARANWTQVKAQTRDVLPEFAEFLERWGSPQLRNAGTVAGSIAGASAISDSLPFLLVCEAKLELLSVSGTRMLPISQFLNGEAMQPDELLRRVVVPLPSEKQKLRLFKVSKRRAFDRSIVSAAFLLSARDNRIENVRIALGGVAATALRLPQTEAFLRDKPLENATWRAAGEVALQEISPRSDASASREYRQQLVASLLRKFGSE
ncbi:MAG TPA: FAD binding domain-containing protein [Abditibacterium sp.]